MSKRGQVYLPELDSVRNSDYEIQVGQEALWRELVHNGHSVVLSLNQLTDSPSFLSLALDERTFDEILALAQIGAIKVNLFKDVRTPSQYVQESIDKYIDNSNRTFLFSGLPFVSNDKDFLTQLSKSLKNSDPYLLQKNMGVNENSDQLVRFVKIILAMSTNEVALNAPKKGCNQKLNDLIREILNAVNKNNIKSMTLEILEKEDYNINIDVYSKLFDGASEKLISISNTANDSTLQDEDPLEGRSVWYQKVDASEIQDDGKVLASEIQDDVKVLAKAMVDVFYNLVIQLNMENVPNDLTDSDSKQKKFLEELTKYYNTLLREEVKEKRNQDGWCFSKENTKKTYKKWEIAKQIWETWDRRKDKLSSTGKDDGRNEWVEFFAKNAVFSSVIAIIRYTVYILISMFVPWLLDNVNKSETVFIDVRHIRTMILPLILIIVLFVIGDFLVGIFCEKYKLDDTLQTGATVHQNIINYYNVKKGEYFDEKQSGVDTIPAASKTAT